MLERLGQRQEGGTIIGALRRHIARIFGLDVVRAKRAEETFDLWLMTGQRGRLILPASPGSAAINVPPPRLTLPG
jgi:hypothetical protein